MRKAIIYVGGFELPDRNAAALRVLNNAHVLRGLGYRVILIGVGRDRPYQRSLHSADPGGVDVEAWEIGYPKRRSDWFDAIRADWPIRELVASGVVEPGEIAAVICYNHPGIAQLRIASLARKWGAAALADCTEWYAKRPWTSPANVVKNLDVPLRMHWSNRQMDGLITTAPYITDFYRPTGLPIVEIPTLMESPGTNAPLAEAVQLPLPLIAVASGFSEGARAESIHDRIDWMLELLDGAAVRGADFVLRIAGVDRESYLSFFPAHRKLLERLEGRVEFLGCLPRPELLHLLERSAFALVMRHRTRVTLAGFPSKYAEAITFGTPVICNDIPSIAPYHVEGKTGFRLDLDDRDGAVATLHELLRIEPETVRSMKRFCRSYDGFLAPAFEERMASFLISVERVSRR